MVPVATIALAIGSFIGWEVREVAQVRGPWQVVRSRPVLPWQTTPDAVDTSEAKSYPMVRVRRWPFYLSFRGTGVYVIGNYELSILPIMLKGSQLELMTNPVYTVSGSPR